GRAVGRGAGGGGASGGAGAGVRGDARGAPALALAARLLHLEVRVRSRRCRRRRLSAEGAAGRGCDPALSREFAIACERRIGASLLLKITVSFRYSGRP